MPKNAPSKPSSSSSEDNASPGIVEDDLANVAAQLSISGAADSETHRNVPGPLKPRMPVSSIYIQSDSLEYRGELLENVQYRSKRALNTKAKVSWVYQH
jgi:hypothetical protein